MTIEDLNEVFPETKLDKKKYPTGLTGQLRAYKLESRDSSGPGIINSILHNYMVLCVCSIGKLR